MSKINQIRQYLKKNFKESPYVGDIASNSRVFYDRSEREYVVHTGQAINDVRGTCDEVLERLEFIRDWH